MHDTCNTANATARKLADSIIKMCKEIHSTEEWDALPEDMKNVFDSLCANHTRGLPSLRMNITIKKLQLSIID